MNNDRKRNVMTRAEMYALTKWVDLNKAAIEAKQLGNSAEELAEKAEKALDFKVTDKNIMSALKVTGVTPPGKIRKSPVPGKLDIIIKQNTEILKLLNAIMK